MPAEQAGTFRALQQDMQRTEFTMPVRGASQQRMRTEHPNSTRAVEPFGQREQAGTFRALQADIQRREP